jgi:hypothetical protein
MAVMADASVPSRLSPALEVLFGRVHEAVLKLASAPEDQATLHNIGLVIGRVLDLLEEQAILAAADRLYEAASALQDIRDKRSRSARVTEQAVESRAEALHLALAGFRASLWSAKPNARGRARGLAW